MKTTASLCFGIVTAVVACVATASIASLVMAEPQTHKFANTAASDLWTTTPVRIDRSSQSFERVPALLTTYAVNAPKPTDVARLNRAVVSEPVAHSEISSQHDDWCGQRYRSFDPTTNSYRSFTGEMKSCSSPYDGKSDVATATIGGQRVADPTTVDVASWCAARYQSYRPEDNSYQPFDGPRRTCQGPRPGNEMASR